jgi:3-oxoacyl-[acyl-carrier protein] reductase
MSTEAIDSLAVITGAARGIGFPTAARLAADGFRVVLTDIDGDAVRHAADRIRQATGRAAEGETLDVRDSGACEALIAGLDRVDTLVNNAGVFDVKKTGDLTPDEFRRMYDVNLIGSFILARAAANRMLRGGKIVNIASRGECGCAEHYRYAAPGRLVARIPG